MIRNFFLLAFTAILSLSLISCSSKKKDAAETEVSAGSGDESGEDSNTSEKSITFNPDGSDSGSISGLTTVNFDYDKSTLTAAARQQLSQNADWIKTHTEANVQIEGHCDEHGSIEYNLALGERRAQAVKKYLVSLGVDSKRLSIISYGEEKLLATGDSDSIHAKNRRANFLPIPR